MAPINLPDGTEVSEVILPDGATASEVIAPDGSTVLSAIPDTAVLQHTGDTYATGDATWVDDIGSADISLSGDPQAVTLSDGSEAVESDGNDSGTATLPSSLDGSSLQSFTVEFAIQTTTTAEADIFGLGNNTGAQRLLVTANIDPSGSNDGSFEFVLDDTDNNRFRFGPSSANLNDGNRHDVTVIVNDASNNDAEVIIDGTNKSLTTGATQSPDNFVAWDTDFGYFASNRGGSISNNWAGAIAIDRWHDTNISSQTI